MLLYLNLSEMLGSYLQQTTSADIIFQMYFFGHFKGYDRFYCTMKGSTFTAIAATEEQSLQHIFMAKSLKYKI